MVMLHFAPILPHITELVLLESTHPDCMDEKHLKYQVPFQIGFISR